MKIRLILLLLIAFLGVSAQDTNRLRKIDMSRKGFSLEPIFGIGTSEAVQNGTNNLGWKFGAGVVYMFNDHFGVSSGLELEEYTTSGISSGIDSEISHVYGTYEENNISATYKFTYLEIPILFRYISSRDKKFGIFIEGGIIIDCLLAGKEVDTAYTSLAYPGGNGPTVTNNYSPNTVSSKASPFVLQWHWALGFFIPLGEKASLVIDVSDNLGITNVGNSSNDYYDFDIGKLYYYNNAATPRNPTILNYGINFSFLFDVRLNIKLGN